MQTLGATKQQKSKVTTLQKEMQRVQKCIRRKISYANQSGTYVDTVAEQYIELPRALCDANGVLNKGQKSVAIKFYETRYNSKEDVLTSTLPWCPDTVIMEGMFLIMNPKTFVKFNISGTIHLWWGYRTL